MEDYTKMSQAEEAAKVKKDVLAAELFIPSVTKWKNYPPGRLALYARGDF